MTPATHYYVWYRVAGDPAAARTAIDAALQDVAVEAGVAGRLLVRRDDPRTWMEVYEHVVDGARFERALAAAAARHALPGHAEDGVRHVEPFVASP